MFFVQPFRIESIVEVIHQNLDSMIYPSCQTILLCKLTDLSAAFVIHNVFYRFVTNVLKM